MRKLIGPKNYVPEPLSALNYLYWASEFELACQLDKTRMPAAYKDQRNNKGVRKAQREPRVVGAGRL